MKKSKHFKLISLLISLVIIWIITVGCSANQNCNTSTTKYNNQNSTAASNIQTNNLNSTNSTNTQKNDNKSNENTTKSNTSNENTTKNNTENSTNETTINNSKDNNTSAKDKKLYIKITIANKKFDLSTLLNAEDVQDLNDFQLSLLRNAYYAKHGYKFKMGKYSNYFSKYDWYIPKYDDVANMLCNTDIDNINLILKIEGNKKSEENIDSNNKVSSAKNTNKYKGFIFPNSDKKLISNEELNYCDKFTLLLAKNELFARKGYRFKNKQLLNYFSNMSWYTPNDNIKNSVDELNEIEKKNLELINEKYNNLYYLSGAKDNTYEINTKMDLNNDGIKENINILFKKDPLNPSFNSWHEYDFTINSNGKKYTFKDTESNLYANLFFADFDVNDNTTEFYLTSAGPSDDPTTTIFQLSENGIKKILTLQGFITGYDGKGNIYTDFSFTNDKNQILLSYYNLKKGVQHPNNNEIIGKYLQYDYRLMLFKTQHGQYGIPGISPIGDSYYEENKEYLTKKVEDGELVKITDINEPLKIIYVYYDESSPESIWNLPIRVETKDGLRGWLLYLNGGD
ncbi:hypothetical protein CLTEP_21430 [Clostridium tepidiprofundi DSM 19306]|uniref:YARHG domain-containing protein n=1 Tax=Clostridium tepidiprofundi DSM 19306 TaxID=1121338 RepID=A0A151B041_9CLOT|nr:YARHG domain-containing protein [Clostridium tepidiprofundi]KYH33285.1 hypothetical protein CLTEP_21430 [Clostridium tepidiprofundi DSM 19306]